MKRDVPTNNGLYKNLSLGAVSLSVILLSVPALAERTVVAIGETETIENTTYENLPKVTSTGGGGAIYSTGDTTVDNVTFDSNSANEGGAISTGVKVGTEFVGTMTITNSTFENNTADVAGGAIRNRGALTISGSSFNDNAVTTDWCDGGAIYSSGSALTISDNTTFDGNNASFGGALFVGGNSIQAANINISDTVFSNNTATTIEDGASAGALYYAVDQGSNESNMNVTRVKFINNSATSNNNSDAGGGAAYLLSKSLFDTVEFTGNSVNANTDGGGAAFLGSKSRTTFRNTSFDSNTSSGVGGAIATRVAINPNSTVNDNSFAKLDILSSTFTNNTAGTFGGAIYNTLYNSDTAAGSAYVGNSTFTENSAKRGGAIYIDGKADAASGMPSMKIENSTFDSNTATQQGGAIRAYSALAISNSAFTNNAVTTDQYDGGAIYSSGSALTISGNTTFDGNRASYGGALFMGGTSTQAANINISDTVFSNNAAITDEDGASAGALYYAKDFTGIESNMNVTRVKFINNSATSIDNSDAGGGAAYLLAKSVFDTVEFTGNSVNANTDGGGAAFLGAESRTTFRNTSFVSNLSSGVGGAIATRSATLANNTIAKLDVLSSTFTDNTAGTFGGAIYNTFYNSDTAAGSAYVGNSTFTGNSASNGGAIYNNGVADKGGNFASMKIADTNFTDNYASTNGGAIYNASTMIFDGNVMFANNFTGLAKNDIYNTGTLNIVGGTLTLDGGITGNGTVNFTDGTSLSAKLLTDASASPIITASTLTGNINLVANSVGQIKFDAADISGFSIYDNNALYNITGVDGLYSVVAKSSGDLETTTGANAQQAEMMSGIITGTSSNAVFTELQTQITTLLQSGNADDVATALNMLSEMAPTTAPVSVANATSTAGQVFAAIGTRLNGGAISASGQSSGDFTIGESALWVQGLYNQSKLSGNNGFDSKSKGIALGMEYNFTDSVKFGAGYAYTNSEIEPSARKSDVESNTAIVYGEYKPNKWFANAVASYTWSAYDTDNFVGATTLHSEYNVKSLALQAMGGYDFDANIVTITPEAGLRYMNVEQDSFTDTAGSKFDAIKSDILTGVAGVKFASVWNLDNDFSLTPELRVGATYDIVNDDSVSVMTLANGSVISTTGKALAPLAGVVGVGLTATVSDSTDISLVYEGQFRQDYTDNTGMVMFKVRF